MKVPNFDKSYVTKQTHINSEAKSSARMKGDWTYHVPMVDDNDSEEYDE